MQRFAWTLACSMGILVGFPTFSLAGWAEDLESAQAEAQETDKPLLIHFYADWCGPCQQMEATVLNADAVVEACGTACVAVKLNFDHHKVVAKRYGVAALPTDVIVSPDGEVISRHVGKASVSEYIARMDAAARQAGPAPALSNDSLLTADLTVLLTKLAREHGVGLKEYSPVALTTERVWTKGSSEFAWRHAGVMYYMANADELALFKKDPDKYAPRFSGFDPLILSVDGAAVPGLIVYGSFYKGHLHLHATRVSREKFLEDPANYPVPTKMEIPAFLAQKKPVIAEIPAS